MVDDPINSIRIPGPDSQALSKNQQTILNELSLEITQEDSGDEIGASLDASSEFVNPALARQRFEPLEVKIKKKGKDEEEAEKAESKTKKIQEIQRLEQFSEEFEKRNPELKSRSLLILKARISKNDSKEEILKKVLEAYPDYSNADDALDFLIEASTEKELKKRLLEAKKELNTLHKREIVAGKNIKTQVGEFSTEKSGTTKGLAPPTALRDLYRDVTGNPRESVVLFNELAQNFSYEKMKLVIEFLLHSLGADLKSKGPSIARGELHRLVTETRSLQAILGVYKFFKLRIKTIKGAFKRKGLLMSDKLTFELLAREFVKFLQERYPSTDKVLLMALIFEVSEELLGQIIIYTELRDAIRQVAPKLFRSEPHRQDVLKTFNDAIENLDIKLEEKAEEEEDKKKKKNSPLFG